VIVSVLFNLVACALGGPPPDLWVDVDLRDGNQRVAVHLPANGLLEREEPLTIETTQGPIDLRQQAIAFRGRWGRQSKTWVVTDGEVRVSLAEQRPTRGARAEMLKLATKGPGGLAIELSFPLDRDGDGRCGEKLRETIAFDGVDFELGPAICQQLARHGPTTVLSVEGGFLGGATLLTE